MGLPPNIEVVLFPNAEATGTGTGAVVGAAGAPNVKDGVGTAGVAVLVGAAPKGPLVAVG